MTSAGIRYSNIEPAHDTSAEPRPTGVRRAAEPEPVVGVDVALGDGQEAGETSLRGQQVVVARVQRAVEHPEADREELPSRIEQEAEVHLAHETVGRLGDRLQPANDRRGGLRSGFTGARVANRRARQSSGSRRPEGTVRTSLCRGRWLVTTLWVASAHVTNSVSRPSPRSAVNAEATSDSVRDIAESSTRWVDHAFGVDPTFALYCSGNRRASSRCRRVSVWLRRSSAIASAAPRTNVTASLIPFTASSTGSG